MAQCVECKVSMGYTETNVAREHKGLCVACHVKSLVKQKVSAANKPYSPTNVRSIDNLFSKFEDMLITVKLPQILGSADALVLCMEKGCLQWTTNR